MNDLLVSLTFVLERCISRAEILRGCTFCSCVGVVIGVGDGVNGGLMELELLKKGGFEGFKTVRLDGGDRTLGVKTAVL